MWMATVSADLSTSIYLVLILDHGTDAGDRPIGRIYQKYSC